MGTLILDTNVVSYLMRGKPLATEYRQLTGGHTLAISFMTVGELYEGARRARWGDERLASLRSVLRGYLVIPYSWELCVTWADIRVERQHQPISVDDAWIAATALTHRCPLVTHNPRDFEGVSQLQVLTVPTGGRPQ